MTSSEEFRKFGTAMINYVADYLDNIRDRQVVPEVNNKDNLMKIKVGQENFCQVQ